MVLVDSATQGAGELVAAALKDNRRGTVVGQRTRGNAISRAWFGLDEGDAIWLAVSRVRRQSGIEIEGKGVEPDAVVSASLGANTRIENVQCPGSRMLEPLKADPELVVAVELLGRDN